MKNKMTKKVLSLFLAFLLLLTVTPMNIFAGALDGPDEGTVDEPGVDITADFADDRLKGALLAILGKDDGIILEEDVVDIAYLNLSNKGIKSLAGIEHFTGLTSLDCSNNEIGSIDFTGLDKLTYLNCANNKLDSSFDVSGLSRLGYLDCSGNNISSLQIYSLPELNVLYCSNNNLSVLTLSNLPSLSKLNCSGNNLMYIPHYGLPALSYINCTGNQMGYEELQLLTQHCRDNSIKLIHETTSEADYGNDITDKFTDENFKEAVLQALGKYGTTIGGNEKEVELVIYDAEVAELLSLDIKGKGVKSLAGLEYFTSLLFFDCSDNDIETLDVQAFGDLEYLNCSGNKLTSLNVSGLYKLKLLDCSFNEITAFTNTSPLNNLTYFNCSNNFLTGLPLANLPNLKNLKCAYNRLTGINLSVLAGRLENFDFHYNFIEDLSDIVGYTVTDSDITIQQTDPRFHDKPAFAPTLSYEATGDTEYTVTIKEVEGIEYSFDGKTFSDVNTLEGCLAKTTVTGYIRYAETEVESTSIYLDDYTIKAGESVSSFVLLPLISVQKPAVAAPSDMADWAFAGSLDITLASATVGAAIHYTTDGSEPTAESPKYDGPFKLTAATVVKAIAVKENMADSDVLTATFNKKVKDYSNNQSESVLMLGQSSAKKNSTMVNDPSYKDYIVVEIIGADGKVSATLAPKSLTVNGQQYIIKLPAVKPGFSVRVSLAGIPGLLDQMVLAEYQNSTKKNMNGTLHAVIESHPVTRARQLHIAGKTCDEIAAVLFREFGLGSVQTAQIMAGEKFSYAETAKMLRDVGKYEPAQIAYALHVAYNLPKAQPLMRTGLAVRSVIDPQTAEAAATLRSLGFTAFETAEALKQTYGAAQGVILTVLRDVAYSVSDITLILKDFYRETDLMASKWLDTLGYTAEVVAYTMTEVYGITFMRYAEIYYNALNYSADVIWSVLAQIPEVGSVGDIVELMLGATVGLDEIVVCLHDLADYSVEGIIGILHDALPGGDMVFETIGVIANVLVAALGETIQSVTGGLIEVFGAESVAEAMINVLYMGVEAVADIFGMWAVGVEVVVEALQSLGIKDEAILEALDFAGYYLPACVECFENMLSVPVEYLAKWIVHGDFDAADIYQVFFDFKDAGLGDLLEFYDVLGSFSDDMIVLLKDWGVAGDIIAPIFVALKYPLAVWGAAYSWIYEIDPGDIVNYTMMAYNETLDGILWLWKQAGYGAEEIAGYIAAGGEYINYALTYSAQQIAYAFHEAYDFSLEKLTFLLEEMKYAVSEVIEVAKTIYDVVSEAAVQAYTEVLEAAGYAADAIKSAADTVWGFMKDAWSWLKGLFS